MSKSTLKLHIRKKRCCKRCQRFGHSKNQCFRPFRCVKCGNEHSTTSCVKPPETEATCANCQGKHPASYKGCIKYMQYKEKIFKTEPKSRQTKQQLHKATQQQQSINENAKPTPRTTYSDILKNRQNNFKKQPINATIAEPGPQDNITSLLDTMFNKFQAIMKDMIDNMMDQMIKLITRLAPQRD
ncbi:Nucleic-acid-binding protein from transposon X-element [Eumeta japonica]|uniref:Nucleic-acid-binding protein from transposon X-element n=1 Tax=Eumeta variegata TaxID=151549 RepID=A0A4C1XDL1_EUMVA|nr:Nucleic-acid-binding protein from transposon X-element [Eumeta japonica]